MTDHLLRWIGREDKNPRHDEKPESVSQVTTGGGDDEGAPPVCIGVIEGQLRAHIARSFLEDSGFTVFLQGETVSSVYGVFSGPLAEVRIFVPASQAEEAARVFAEFDPR